MTTTDEQTQTATPSSSPWRTKRLYRSRDQRMLGGVAGGMADYLGVDPTIVRLCFVLTAFFGGAGIVAYAVAWLIVPEG